MTQVGIDIDGEANYDNFGYDVSLSSDGSIVAVGSRANDGSGIDSGHVRVFNMSGLLNIEDHNVTTQVVIEQNPVDNILKIHVPVNLDFSSAVIYNSIGQLVLKSQLSDINVSKLEKGIYFLEVETKFGKATIKFIKKQLF